MPTTSNFGWTTPADTDLVKDGALAIRTLGNGIDTSMAELKGGTTGQVLSKASNTDMDFTWTTDASGISPTIVDAKGDLIAASAADTPARLAVGNNGETLVADSAATTGLRWQGNYSAGKNKIINGDFGIWQRGTSITYVVSTFTYTADRWSLWHNGSTAGTNVLSQQTFTPGTAPVAGYEGQYFARQTITTVGSGQTVLDFNQRIEDVRTFAGQTVTVSFWAKSSASWQPQGFFVQNFGSGGSSSVDTTLTFNTSNTTTSWQRYTATVTLPSVSGKTIGTSSYLNLGIRCGSLTNGQTNDIWGVQVEAGSVATAFQTATGTLQGELAACQRYYYRQSGGDTYGCFATGAARSTTVIYAFMPLPVTMRVAPTSMDLSTISVEDYSGTTWNSGTFTLESGSQQKNMAWIRYTHGSAVFTQYRPAFLSVVGSSSAYIGFSAEL